MANPAPPTTTVDLKRLKWRKDGGVLFATHETCMYMRETGGSVVSGFIFGTALCLGLGGSGVKMLMEPAGTDGKFFGVFALLLGLFFGFLVVVCLRRGRWLIAYDRGAGQIRYGKDSLAVSQVRCLTTQSVGGNPPQRMIVAELHDGKYISIGPSGASTWPAHWAKQAADWMGIQYRDSST